eukprot:scaffold67201_cov30-Prasinocladus_malaysianus.AAC.1
MTEIGYRVDARSASDKKGHMKGVREKFSLPTTVRVRLPDFSRRVEVEFQCVDCLAVSRIAVSRWKFSACCKLCTAAEV